jgi:hypothetical protein
MKARRILMGVLTLAMVATTLFGCKKEKSLNGELSNVYYNSVQSKIPYSEIKVREKSCKGENGSGSILVFNSMDALRQTIDDLDNQVKSLENVFYVRNYNLSNEERTDLQERINFESSQPISTFNEFLSFASLFQEIKNDEEIWLANDSLDYASDPNNHFVQEESIRAILNTDCEVQVADTIYKLVEGGYYAIPVSRNNFDADRILLDLAGNNVFYFGEEMCDECKSGNCFSGKLIWWWEKNEANDKKIKWTLAHQTWFWSRYVRASVTNYTKRKLGIGWKKYSTYCEVQVAGYVSGASGDCSTMANFNPTNEKKTSTSAKTLDHKIYVNTKTQAGWVQGYYFGAEGVLWTASLN